MESCVVVDSRRLGPSRFARYWPKPETLSLARFNTEGEEEAVSPSKETLSGLGSLKVVSAQHGISTSAFIDLLLDLPETLTSFVKPVRRQIRSGSLAASAVGRMHNQDVKL